MILFKLKCISLAKPINNKGTEILLMPTETFVAKELQEQQKADEDTRHVQSTGTMNKSKSKIKFCPAVSFK